MQAAAGMGIFGPRTVYCIALKDAPGTHEFLLQDDGKWMHVKETTEIGESLTYRNPLLRPVRPFCASWKSLAALTAYSGIHM